MTDRAKVLAHVALAVALQWAWTTLAGPIALLPRPLPAILGSIWGALAGPLGSLLELPAVFLRFLH